MYFLLMFIIVIILYEKAYTEQYFETSICTLYFIITNNRSAKKQILNAVYRKMQYHFNKNFKQLKNELSYISRQAIGFKVATTLL